MTFKAVIDWADTNYGLIIIVAVILIISGYNYYKKHYGKRRVQKQPNAIFEESYLNEFPELFEGITDKDTLSPYNKQKLSIENNLQQIRANAKKVVEEEHKFDSEYRQRKLQFLNEKKRLGLNYTNYMHQSKIIDEMLQNQNRMQEEFERQKKEEI